MDMWPRNRPSYPPELTRDPELVTDAYIVESTFQGSLLDEYRDTLSLTGFATRETQLPAASVHRETAYPHGVGVYRM